MPAVRTLLSALALACLLALNGPAALRAEEDLSAHKAALEAAKVKTDGPGLLEFFRARTLSEEQRGKLAGLVRQLGSNEYEERVKASEELSATGRKAVPFLRPALRDPDLEVRRRARWALESIESAPETNLVLSAVALLTARRPAGASEALLAFLPCAEEPVVEQTVFEGLLALAAGKADPALVKAVKSRLALQRGAAGWVLGRSKSAEVRTLAVPLLKDPDLSVRFRTAEALVAGRDRRGVSALVGLLDGGSPDLAAQSESILGYLAGENAPAIGLGNNPAERRACREAWDAWYNEYGAALDLARLDVERRVLGLRLVVVLNGYGGKGAIFEYGNDHKDRWELRDVGGPFDARVLPGGTLLVAEYEGSRVTERDKSGKVLWEHRTPQGVLEAQRLPSGNTLITTNYEIREVTRDGKVVFQHHDRSGNIFTGQRLATGHTLCGLYSGHLVELDRTGKEVKRIEFERPAWGLINVEVLPGGHYLIPFTGSNRVVEMDPSGKVTWQASVSSPTSVALLPGGNLLVGSHRMNNVREIDRKGNVVWERRCDGQVFRVRVR